MKFKTGMSVGFMLLIGTGCAPEFGYQVTVEPLSVQGITKISVPLDCYNCEIEPELKNKLAGLRLNFALHEEATTENLKLEYYDYDKHVAVEVECDVDAVDGLLNQGLQIALSNVVIERVFMNDGLIVCVMPAEPFSTGGLRLWKGENEYSGDHVEGSSRSFRKTEALQSFARNLAVQCLDALPQKPMDEP